VRQVRREPLDRRKVVGQRQRRIHPTPDEPSNDYEDEQGTNERCQIGERMSRARASGARSEKGLLPRSTRLICDNDAKWDHGQNRKSREPVQHARCHRVGGELRLRTSSSTPHTRRRLPPAWPCREHHLNYTSALHHQCRSRSAYRGVHFHVRTGTGSGCYTRPQSLENECGPDNTFQHLPSRRYAQQ
jgi:hypothetical protein